MKDPLVPLKQSCSTRTGRRTMATILIIIAGLLAPRLLMSLQHSGPAGNVAAWAIGIGVIVLIVVPWILIARRRTDRLRSRIEASGAHEYLEVFRLAADTAGLLSEMRLPRSFRSYDRIAVSVTGGVVVLWADGVTGGQAARLCQWQPDNVAGAVTNRTYYHDSIVDCVELRFANGGSMRFIPEGVTTLSGYARSSAQAAERIVIPLQSRGWEGERVSPGPLALAGNGVCGPRCP